MFLPRLRGMVWLNQIRLLPGGSRASECFTDRHGVSFHAAWGPEAFQLSSSSAGCSPFALFDWGGRDIGILRWPALAHRSFQPPSSLSAVRANGSSLFPGACAAGILAFVEQRGVGGDVLFCLSLLCRRGRRLLGRRLSVAARGYFYLIGTF